MIKPTLTIDDYYATIEKITQEIGLVRLFADYPGITMYSRAGEPLTVSFGHGKYEHGLELFELLVEEKIVNENQITAFRRGEEVKIDDFVAFSNVFHDLAKSKGDRGAVKYLGIHTVADLDHLRHYADDGRRDAASGGSYFVIDDGVLETVVTEEDGSTTRVKVGTVDVDELFSYWARENNLTVEQRDAYGATRTLVVSVEDVADAFEFAAGTGGSMFELDAETVGQVGQAVRFLLEGSVKCLSWIDDASQKVDRCLGDWRWSV